MIRADVVTRLYFKNTFEPWGLTIAGQQIYVVTSPADVSAVYKNVKQLTFDDYIEDMMLRFGTSRSAVDIMLQKSDALNPPSSDLQRNPTKNSLLQFCQSLYHQAICPGEKLDTFQDVLLGIIDKSLTWESMTPTAILSSASAPYRTVSLLCWAKDVLLDGATKAFFGNRLIELEPKLYEKFGYFDDNSWKFTYNLPRVWSSDVYNAKGVTQDAMKAYLDLPKEQRPGASWLIQSMEAEMRARGIGTSDIAPLFVMTFWVINGNAYKLCFWVLTHILHDPSLLASTRTEAISAVRSSGGSPNSLAANLEDKCPHLNAVLNETLRITSASSTIRNVVDSFTLGGKRLRKGTKVLIPGRQLHLDERAFGVDAKSFDPERFLAKKDLVRSSNFRPFGGGTTYCPGRFLAKREVLTFVALVLARFELSLSKPENGATVPFPQIEDGKPCLGLMGPRFGWDTTIQIQKV
ncbi:MAG: hypothetical protein LQ341_004999 [Variospora aurantia]|nr:MAG: hypothetical protein LQ341_004999 [Variospora aurantia]